MARKIDTYKPFEGLNLSNSRSEDETYEQYKGRLRQNREILKTYNLYGREVFKDMFPDGVAKALQSSPEEAAKKAHANKLGGAK